MSEVDDGPQRRRHRRFDGRQARVRFRRLSATSSGEKDFLHEGRLLDVSKGGMCFSTDHWVGSDEEIEFHIAGFDGGGDRCGTGRVVRLEKEVDRYFVGVSFHSIRLASAGMEDLT